MKTKTIIASIALSFSAAAFAGADCKAPCKLEQASSVEASLHKKIAVLPLDQTDAHNREVLSQCFSSPECKTKLLAKTQSQFSMAEINAAPAISLPAAAQFRFGQVIGWCLASPDCKAKLRVELVKHDGPWAADADFILQMIDDPQIVDANQMTWVKGEGK